MAASVCKGYKNVHRGNESGCQGLETSQQQDVYVSFPLAGTTPDTRNLKEESLIWLTIQRFQCVAKLEYLGGCEIEGW